MFFFISSVSCSILHPTRRPSNPIHPSTYSLRCDIRLRRHFFLISYFLFLNFYFLFPISYFLFLISYADVFSFNWREFPGSLFRLFILISIPLPSQENFPFNMCSFSGTHSFKRPYYHYFKRKPKKINTIKLGLLTLTVKICLQGIFYDFFCQ